MRLTNEIGTHVQVCICLKHETRVGWTIAEYQLTYIRNGTIVTLCQINAATFWKLIEKSAHNWQMKSFTICLAQTNAMLAKSTAANSFIRWRKEKI